MDEHYDLVWQLEVEDHRITVIVFDAHPDLARGPAIEQVVELYNRKQIGPTELTKMLHHIDSTLPLPRSYETALAVAEAL